MVGVHPKGGGGSEIDDSVLGIVFDDGEKKHVHKLMK